MANNTTPNTLSDMIVVDYGNGQSDMIIAPAADADDHVALMAEDYDA